MVAKIWGGIGAVVAIGFLVVGIDRIDDAAHDSYMFRLLLIPGIIMLWPIVVWRWRVLEKNNKYIGKDSFRPPRGTQGWLAVIVSVAVVVVLFIAFNIKQNTPSEYEPQKLSDRIIEKRNVG